MSSRSTNSNDRASDVGEILRKPLPAAEIFLGALSTALFIVAAFGYFQNKAEPITGGLLLAGTILASLAAFFRRIEGVLKVTKDGAEIPIGEYEAQKGRIVPAPKPTPISGGEPLAPAETETRTGLPEVAADEQANQHERGADGGRDATRGVFLTAQANDQYSRLDSSQRDAVQIALATLGESPDPKIITSANTGGRAYSVRMLKDQNLQLVYRNIDKKSPAEPDSYVVIAIENIK
jgi:hypothetical protein